MAKSEASSGISARRSRIVFSLLVWMGLSMNLDHPGKDQILLNLLASFRHFDLAWLLVLPGVYAICFCADRYASDQNRWTRWVPACFFGLNMVFGYAFAKEGNGAMLLSLQGGQLLKTVIVFLSWSVIFDRVLGLAYTLLDKIRVLETERKKPTPVKPGGFHPFRWYMRLLRRHTFLTPFLTLLILYIPHFLIAYPAMFMGDTWCMIVQGYPELGMTGVDYISPESVLQPGVLFNQHHPVFYTLCLHGFLRLGEDVFHSLDIGIFLFCLLQAMGMLAAFAFAVSTFTKRGIRSGYLIALILYFFLHPQIRNFLFLVTKDGAYTACFIALMACFFRQREGEKSRSVWFLLCLCGLGVVLLRNEGKYVLLISGLLMALLDRESRKAILGFTAAMTVLALGIYQGLYPSLGFTKGGTQEALSVPFQQTARYVLEHPEEVASEERAAIDGILEYDRLAESYNPDGSDAVKGLFRQDASMGDLLAYFRAWVGMGIRHPETYLRATYANYYEYLYPGEVRISYYKYGWSAWMCEFANDRIEAAGKRFTIPDWNKRFRYLADSLVDAGLFHLAPFSLMMTPALYSWSLIALVFWVCGRRKGSGRRNLLSILIPSGIVFLVIFAGPTNGYYSRYLLTLTAFLPALALMLVSERGELGNG